jgi:hypothetical protein
MIRHKQFITNGGKNGSARYFTDHLSVSDYYEKGVGLLKSHALRFGSKIEGGIKRFSARSAMERRVVPQLV